MDTGSAGFERRLRALTSRSPRAHAPERPVPLLRRPDRYRVRDEGGERVLLCVEAPTLRVRLQRGAAVPEAAARGAEPGTIFLDGAAACAPFADPKRAVYNLDHHEGCVRSFTLATCEQAMVLIRKLQDLRKRDWTIRANDADLDAVLAIWVLFNHLRLNADERVRAAVIPLLRLEGAIDARGLDMLDFLAMPEETLRTARSWMERLREPEVRYRERGRWERIDLAEYTADRLRAIDDLVYASSELEEIAEIEEIARADLTGHSVAVVCRSEVGIYEVERQLLRFHGDRLGVIVLQTGERSYSLRQVDRSLPADLGEVYAHLNRIDPAAGGSRSGNRWGGSTEIGGSPRATGTRLSAQQILEALAHVERRPTRSQRLAASARAALLAAAALLVGLAGLPLLVMADALGFDWGLFTSQPQAAFGAALALPCAAFLIVAWRRAPGLYGLRRPVGMGWCLALAPALAGALLGGVWAPAADLVPGSGDLPALAGAVGVAALLASCAEILFRGLVYGTLGFHESALPPRRAWRPTRPAWVSAALYAACAAIPFLDPALPPVIDSPLAGALPFAGGLLFGLAAARARERSESLLPPILLHGLGISALVLVRDVLA
jgi:membrane protease YdiL (CAAX protease family)